MFLSCSNCTFPEGIFPKLIAKRGVSAEVQGLPAKCGLNKESKANVPFGNFNPSLGFQRERKETNDSVMMSRVLRTFSTLLFRDL